MSIVAVSLLCLNLQVIVSARLRHQGPILKTELTAGGQAAVQPHTRLRDFGLPALVP